MKAGKEPAPDGLPRRQRLPRIPCSLILLLALAACPLCGQGNDGSLEARVKAAYIYNFTKFVSWRGAAGGKAGSPVTICLIGDDPVAAELERFAGSQPGWPIVVRRVDPASGDLSPCQLAFIARSVERGLPGIFNALQGANILTVSDIPGFAHRGGMIGFVIENGRVRIEINLPAANQARLEISAKLLEVARIVTHAE